MVKHNMSCIPVLLRWWNTNSEAASQYSIFLVAGHVSQSPIDLLFAAKTKIVNTSHDSHLATRSILTRLTGYWYQVKCHPYLPVWKYRRQYSSLGDAGNSACATPCSYLFGALRVSLIAMSNWSRALSTFFQNKSKLLSVQRPFR